MNFEKNDLFIGAFVAAAGLIFLLTLAAVNRERLTTQTYHLQIELPNIAGIDKGVEVVYRGYKAGAVDGVRIAYEPEFRFIVRIAVKREIRLRGGTTVIVRNKGFGGAKYLELSPPPDAAGQRMIAPGEVLPTVSDMDLMSKASDVMGDVQKTLRSLQKEGTTADLMATVRQAKASMTNLDRTLSEMNALMEENRTSLRQSLASLKEAAAHLPAMAVNMEELSADLKRHPWRLVRKGKEDPVVLDHKHPPAAAPAPAAPVRKD